MRVLHLGNVANNAYNNAKLLRCRGIDAHVLTYDYDYVMGQPEWEDAQIEAEIPEHFAQWDRIELGGFERPPWFRQVRLRSDSERWLASIVRRLGLAPTAWRLHSDLRDEYVAKVGRGVAPLLYVDMLRYLRFYRKLSPLLDGWDLIQAYGTDPILAMLMAPDTPLVAYEHGTMRHVPYERTPTGRLLSLAYHRAAAVIITNADVIDSAGRLGLENTTFVPHPIDEEKYRPGPSSVGEALRAEHDFDLLLLAPARHNWEIKGNDRVLTAVARLVRETRRRPLLLLCDWGQQMHRSRRLMRKLDIERHVLWLPPLPKMKLLQYYRASDVVLDQFVIGTFGTVAPEAMATAKPVILHFDADLHRWCYDAMPPVVAAQTADEIVARLTELYDNEERRRIGEAGRAWICEHHSSEIVVDRQIGIYERILTR